MVANPVIGVLLMGHIIFGGMTIYLLYDKFSRNKEVKNETA